MKKNVLIIIGVLVLGIISLGFYLPSYYLKQVRLSLDESIPNNMTLSYDENVDASLYSSFPFVEVEFDNITLNDSTGTQPIIQAKRLDLKVNLISLTTNRGVNIESLKINELLYRDTILFIEDLNLKYEGKTPSERRELQEIDLSAKGIKYEGERNTKFDLEYKGKIYTTHDSELKELRLDLETSEVKLNDKTEFDIDGFINLANGKLSYDINIVSEDEIEISEVIAMVDSTSIIGGKCYFELQIKDPLSSGDITANANIRLKDGSVIYNDVVIDSLSFVADLSVDNIKGQIVNFQTFAGKIDNSTVVGVGKYTNNIDNIKDFEVATNFSNLDIQSLNKLSSANTEEKRIIDDCEGDISGTITYNASLLEDNSINMASVVSNGEVYINSLIVKNTDIYKSMSEYINCDKNGDLQINDTDFIFTIDNGILTVKKLEFDLVKNCPTTITGSQNLLTDKLNYKLLAKIEKKMFDEGTATLLNAFGLTNDTIELVLDIKGSSESPQIDINIKESLSRNKDKKKPAKSGNLMDLIMNFI